MSVKSRLMDVPNSSRHHLEAWIKEAAETLPAGALVLDAGSGDAPYRSLFDHARYESADFGALDKHYDPPTYVCDLRAIPVEDERFDRVISTQVLEHMPDPAAVMAEFARIVKPGGEVWMSAPLFYEEHEQPYDFYRYTQFGWKHLAEQAGLEVKSIDWLEGYYGTLSYQLRTAAGYVRAGDAALAARGPLGRAALKAGVPPLKVTFVLLSRLFSRLDRQTKVTWAGQPKNYACVLVKPTG